MKNTPSSLSPTDTMRRTHARIWQSLATLTGIDKDLAKQLSIDSPADQSPKTPGRLAGLKWAFVACLIATLLALPVRDLLDLANIVMVYLLAVVDRKRTRLNSSH